MKGAHPTHRLCIICAKRRIGTSIKFSMTESGYPMRRRNTDNTKHSLAKELLQWGFAFAAAFIAAVLINSFILVNAQIPSGSMKDTIMPGDRVFGNRLAYVFGEPERFDIIIFKYPDDESQLFIKRIIGLPGETVEIHDGNIYINGSDEPLDDVETREPMAGSFGPYTVPENCYFVMGDNRNNSRDSRYWEHTFVSEDEILGKAVFRYWPLKKMKLVS